jgi:hypothetical protein
MIFMPMSRFATEILTDGARRIPARPARSEASTILPLPIFDSGIQRKPACACGGSCQRCNDELPSQANRPASGPMTGFVRKAEPAYDGQSECSPTWFGDTSPEVDPSGGSFTGRLIVKYNDAGLKSPCVRECVEEHEAVHVAHLTPIVKMIHECDVAAGSDWEKKGKCNEMASHDLAAIQKRSECEAYRKSFTCLTLKVLDSKSPCSKRPHRDEVQKHRGYEACEMKRYCAEAGTPELGIPNA